MFKNTIIFETPHIFNRGIISFTLDRTNSKFYNTFHIKSTRSAGDFARWRCVILAPITRAANAKCESRRRASGESSIERKARASDGRRVKQCELLRAGACGDCVTSNFKLSIARGLGITSREPHNARPPLSFHQNPRRCTMIVASDLYLPNCAQDLYCQRESPSVDMSACEKIFAIQNMFIATLLKILHYALYNGVEIKIFSKKWES